MHKPSIVTIVCLVIVGAIEATEQALTVAPNLSARLSVVLPGFFTSSNWHFVPLALLIVAGISTLVGRYFGRPSVEILTPRPGQEVTYTRVVRGAVCSSESRESSRPQFYEVVMMCGIGRTPRSALRSRITAPSPNSRSMVRRSV
jgi:hypothetical protein